MRLKVAAGVVLALAVVGGTTFVLTDPDEPGLTVPLAQSLPTEQTSSVTTSTESSTAPPSTTSPVETPPQETPRPQPAPPAPEPVPAPVVTPNAAGRISFYGANNNDPPGSRAIAFTTVLHKQAGGTGTFDDPLTFAAAEGAFKLGTKIYVPDVRRYFILEDLCPGCGRAEVNLWTGPADDEGIERCQKSLKRDGARPYVVNPPAGYPVVTGDLYQGGRCYP
jgi:hypothetical protein